jgi:hypothetical protein
MSEAAEPRPVVVWMRVLDRIEDTLGQSLALAAEPAGGPAPENEPGPLAQRSLEKLDQRLARLQACLDRAEQNADATDSLLLTEADALRAWTEALAAAGRDLADWAARAV